MAVLGSNRQSELLKLFPCWLQFQSLLPVQVSILLAGILLMGIRLCSMAAGAEALLELGTVLVEVLEAALVAVVGVAAVRRFFLRILGLELLLEPVSGMVLCTVCNSEMCHKFLVGMDIRCQHKVRSLAACLSGLVDSCSLDQCCLAGRLCIPAKRRLCLAGRHNFRLGTCILVLLNREGSLRICHQQCKFPLGKCRTAAGWSLAGRLGSWGMFHNSPAGSLCMQGQSSLARIQYIARLPCVFRMDICCIAGHLNLAGSQRTVHLQGGCEEGIRCTVEGLRTAGMARIVHLPSNCPAGILGILVVGRFPGT